MSTALNSYKHANNYVCFSEVFGALDLETLEFIDTQAGAITDKGAVTSIIDGVVIIEYEGRIYEHTTKMDEHDCINIFGELCIIVNLTGQLITVINCGNFELRTEPIGRYNSVHIINNMVALIAGAEITLFNVDTFTCEEFELTTCDQCGQTHEIIMFNSSLQPVTLCGGNIVFPNGYIVPCMEQYSGYNNRYVVTVSDKTYMIYDADAPDLEGTIIANLKGEYEGADWIVFIATQKPALVLLSSAELQFNSIGLVIYNYLNSAAPIKHMYTITPTPFTEEAKECAGAL